LTRSCATRKELRGASYSVRTAVCTQSSGTAGSYLRPLLPSPIRASPRAHDPRSAVPARPPVGERGAAAHGQAARAPRADRVLGLLPGQLAAHASVRARVARALRGRRAPRDRRPHRRLSAVARRGAGARRGGAARARLSRRDRHGPAGVGPLRQRGVARPLPLGPARRAVLAALRRGRLRRDRARAAGAARRAARRRGADAPGGRSRGAARAADHRPARRLLRPLRGRLGLGGRLGPGRAARQRPDGGRGARGLRSAAVRSPSRRSSRGAPVSSTSTAVPGQ
jgi:hypothetical protein